MAILADRRMSTSQLRNMGGGTSIAGGGTHRNDSIQKLPATSHLPLLEVSGQRPTSEHDRNAAHGGEEQTPFHELLEAKSLEILSNSLVHFTFAGDLKKGENPYN